MKALTIGLIALVLVLLTVYMVRSSETLRLDDYARRCKEAGGVVFVFRTALACVKEEDANKVTL